MYSYVYGCVYVRARGRTDGRSCICVYVFVRIKYVLENFDDWIIKYIYMQMAGVRIRLDGADKNRKSNMLSDWANVGTF